MINIDTAISCILSFDVSDEPRLIKHKREACNILNVFYLALESCICQTKWDTL